MSEREALAARLYEHHFGLPWDKAHSDDREHFRMLAKSACTHILRVIDEEIDGWRNEVGPHDGRDMIDALAVLRARFGKADDE